MVRHVGRVMGSVVSALPDLALGATFLVTWIQPSRFGDRMVRHLVLVMLLEFVIIHSAALMGSVAISRADGRGKAKTLLGFALLYSLFAGGFSLAFGSLWPLVAFWGLCLNRLLRVILGGGFGKNEKSLMTAEWRLSTLSYLLFVFVTVLLPIPELGITRAVVSAQDLPGSGLWIDRPQKAIAFGFLYFTTLGIASLVTVKWVPAKSTSSAAVARTP